MYNNKSENAKEVGGGGGEWVTALTRRTKNIRILARNLFSPSLFVLV
jgi:hypothetical protein